LRKPENRTPDGSGRLLKHRRGLIHRLIPFIILLTWICVGCASSPRYRNSALPEPIKPGGRYVETGVASWYGNPYHGRATSSGEIYDMHALTAAHNRLPLGTVVKVTNLENKKSVVVKINDRGPFKRRRIIDLSYAAAQAISMIGPGSVKVRVEVVTWGEEEK
jgi:rare lipoprotein A (peptidoglycan hydrolase)